MINLLIFLVLATLSYPKPINIFLQSDQDTSIGTLGSGLESISSNIASYGDFLSDSIESLQSQMESTEEIYTDTAICLLYTSDAADE